MKRRVGVTCTLLLAAALIPAAYAGQAAGSVAPAHQASPPTAVSPAASNPAGANPAQAGGAGAVNPAVNTNANPPASTECEGAPCPTGPTPHITIATPAPAPSPWPWQDRIRWAAEIIGAIILYVGVMLAVSTLRKIERQSHYAESAAQAAADAAKAALQYAQANSRAERPWILVSAEPAPGAPDTFSVLATNRGRSPARIASLSEGLIVVKDESNLPADPTFNESEMRAPLSSMILLPGEFTVIRTFRRDDVPTVCKNPEELRRVENWEEKIYLYGKVSYVDLHSPDENQRFETGWCCWYIHGRQKSGMVSAGPATYTQHT
jgi:hypothetical protein